MVEVDVWYVMAIESQCSESHVRNGDPFIVQIELHVGKYKHWTRVLKLSIYTLYAKLYEMIEFFCEKNNPRCIIYTPGLILTPLHQLTFHKLVWGEYPRASESVTP